MNKHLDNNLKLNHYRNMKNHHFFTDVASLSAQTGPSFGPVSTTVYRVDRPVLVAEDAIAYAPVNARVLAQWNDQGHLNIIMQPLVIDPVFSNISFIIYKNIDPSSLLSGNNIAARTESDLTELLWTIQERNDAEQEISPSAVPTSDLVNLFTSDTNSDDYVADTYSTLMLFLTENGKNLPCVSSGDSLGRFLGGTVHATIEICTETQTYIEILANSRKSSHTLDVSSISDSSVLKTTREQILNFIDPLAYWSNLSYRAEGIYTVGSDALLSFSTIGVIFAQNRIYLDIRNEDGDSFNFLGEYGNTIAIGIDDVLPTSVDYYDTTQSMEWPILIINQPTAYSTVAVDFTSKIDSLESVHIVQTKPEEGISKMYVLADLTESPVISLEFPLGGTHEVTYRKIILKSNRVSVVDEGVFRRGDYYLNDRFCIKTFKNFSDVSDYSLVIRVIPDAIVLNQEDAVSIFGNTSISSSGIAVDASNVYFFSFPTTKISFNEDQFSGHTFNLQSALIEDEIDFVSYVSSIVPGTIYDKIYIKEHPEFEGIILTNGSGREESIPQFLAEAFECIQFSKTELADLMTLNSADIADTSTMRCFVHLRDDDMLLQDLENVMHRTDTLSVKSVTVTATPEVFNESIVDSETKLYTLISKS